MPERAQIRRGPRIQRVSLVGPPGCGKTTAGRKLAASLDVRFVELDSIFHLRTTHEVDAFLASTTR